MRRLQLHCEIQKPWTRTTSHGRSGKYSHHVAPMLPFVRGNDHTKGNIWNFSAEGLQSCGHTTPPHTTPQHTTTHSAHPSMASHPACREHPHSLAQAARAITERPHAPSGVATCMSAHSKTPYITHSMDFSSWKGVVRGHRGLCNYFL